MLQFTIHVHLRIITNCFGGLKWDSLVERQLGVKLKSENGGTSTVLPSCTCRLLQNIPKAKSRGNPLKNEVSYQTFWYDVATCKCKLEAPNVVQVLLKMFALAAYGCALWLIRLCINRWNGHVFVGRLSEDENLPIHLLKNHYYSWQIVT